MFNANWRTRARDNTDRLPQQIRHNISLTQFLCVFKNMKCVSMASARMRGRHMADRAHNSLVLYINSITLLNKMKCSEIFLSIFFIEIIVKCSRCSDH